MIAPWYITLFLMIPLLLGMPLFKGDKAAKYEENHTTWVYPPWEHTWGIVRATQAHLTFFTLGKASFRNPQGLAAVRLTATDDPKTHNDDDEVTVYGVNSGENAIIYNRSMSSIGLYGYEDEGPGNLDQPWDIAATPGGLVFVTDSGHGRVVKLRNVNGDLKYVASFGNDGPGTLILPRGIAVTGGGKVVVADAGSNRVVLFDTSGSYLNEVGGFDRPVGLAAVDLKSGYTRPADEYFVVSDSGGRRIQKRTFSGHLIASVEVPRATGLENAYVGHLETDLYQSVVATDSVDNCILKFDSRLRFLSAWGEKGTGRAHFTGPTGIAIWRRFGQTFVAEQKGAHYLWVGVDFTHMPHLQVEPDKQTIVLDFGLSEWARLTLQLVDGKGDVVRERFSNQPIGESRIVWNVDRKTRRGLKWGLKESQLEVPPDTLAAGDYTLRIRMRASYSSRKAFEKVIETDVQLPAAPPAEAKPDVLETASDSLKNR